MRNLFGVALTLALLLLAALLLGNCSDDDDDSAGGADDDAVPADDDHATDDDDDDDNNDDDDDNDDATPPPDPSSPGPYGVGEWQTTFHDPSTDQDKPLRVFYPSADGGDTIDDAQGPRPFIVFSPGFSAPMSLYFSYGRHLASYGYIVAHRNNTVASHVDLAATTAAVIDWAEEQESLAGSLFHGKVDFERVGASGHSMGGKISLLTAYNDNRIKASATIDPVDMSPLPTAEYPSVTPELMPEIDIPTLFIGSSNGGLCAPVGENYHQYFLYANPPSIEIEILHSGHVTFCDLPDAVITGAALICPTGGGDYEQIKLLTRRYVAAFYKVVFDGEASYSYYLTGQGMAQDVADLLVETDSKP